MLKKNMCKSLQITKYTKQMQPFKLFIGVMGA